jgi:hypothetical protein
VGNVKDSFELKIGPDGTIETIYQDGIEQFAEEMGADVSTVCRASEVEWEVVEYPDHTEKGWSVRSAKNGLKALRVQYGTQCRIVCSDDTNLAIALFTSREAAIEQEIKHFWELKNG